MILALVVKWFLKMLAEKVIASPIRTFEFWMCAGVLIYFVGNGTPRAYDTPFVRILHKTRRAPQVNQTDSVRRLVSHKIITNIIIF